MYEFGLPEHLHIKVPDNDEPDALFLLTMGTLGDAAAYMSEVALPYEPQPPLLVTDLGFAASFFDAFLAAKFSERLSWDTLLLASSAYYLVKRPGSSLVLAQRLNQQQNEPPTEQLLRWLLQAKWSEFPKISHPYFGTTLEDIAKLLATHFYDGSGLEELASALVSFRQRAYSGAEPRDLFWADVITAIIRMRLSASAWVTLPMFSGIPISLWTPALRQLGFPKELWPSQILLGRAGFLAGKSGVIQMPTSAGKTKSVEMILRSSFLGERAKLAVIVAPFRALCHEIGTSLRAAFKAENIKVNELSDALQMDFLSEIAELLGSEPSTSKFILILTPEKLLYVLRQAQTLIHNIGVVVYDEGHQFDSGSRGVTYELLLTEIKALLPDEAQTILVSAVIRNAQAIGQWLIGEAAQIVDGIGLLPTARSVAFATWLDRLGQLIFFESESFSVSDYFVPRAIEPQVLAALPRERKERYFPEKGEDAWRDISLYLGIRLAPNGAVAIFCGRKDSASSLAERAVDIYARKYQLPPPALYSSADELRRLKYLIERHFGTDSMLSHAAALGIFVHHGNTPHGLRLSIEHAMQKDLIKLVICTSTLAQGVNLPIRYLIVSGIYQAGDRIKTRDFQNLIGRAGRAGMHTEGLVIFADPKVYDKRHSESWRFDMSIHLLKAENSEDTTSSLLGLLDPLLSVDRKKSLVLSLNELCDLLLVGEDGWKSWAAEIEQLHKTHGFIAKLLVFELRRRRKLLSSVESYLMANRGINEQGEFKSNAQQLAAATLAYHLGTESQRSALTMLFGRLADYIEIHVPSMDRQALYAKTLLSVIDAGKIESWVNTSREVLLGLKTNEQWLQAAWPLFAILFEDKFFHTVQPPKLPILLAQKWLQGENYSKLIMDTDAEEATKPWGETKRRRLSPEDVIGFCESTLGYECPLIMAAISLFLYGERLPGDEDSAALTLFQKSLQYGLPDRLAISSYELGFADRAIALELRDALIEAGYNNDYLGSALETHRDVITHILSAFPTYFESVLEGFT